MGDPERAVALFQKYFHVLPESERALYEDLSLVTFPAELETYEAKSGKEREEWLQAFWMKRDMALVSAGKAREAEHYRRVWYARTFFGEKAFPWDRRGEGFFGALSSMVRRIISAGEEEVIVTYERTGDDVNEAIYFELDVANFHPGFSRIRVSVTDLNSLQSATRSAIFHVEE